MTNVTTLAELTALASNDVFYVRDASDTADPDKKVMLSTIQKAAADPSGSVQIDIAQDDQIMIWDVSDPATPRKYILVSDIRPAGAKITDLMRYAGPIVVPALAAGVEADVTIAVAGAAVGDHLVFNLVDALPANLAVLYARVSATDTVQVRFRNLHASTGYAGASLACTALVSRSTA